MSDPFDYDAERKLFHATIPADNGHCDYVMQGWMTRARIAAEREREMVDLLLEAQREGCTRCYSDAVGLPCCYPHSAQCLRITAALKKGPSDDQRRA